MGLPGSGNGLRCIFEYAEIGSRLVGGPSFFGVVAQTMSATAERLVRGLTAASDAAAERIDVFARGVRPGKHVDVDRAAAGYLHTPTARVEYGHTWPESAKNSLVQFDSWEVLSAPVRDHRNRFIGVTFPLNVHDLLSTNRWGRQPVRRGDHEVVYSAYNEDDDGRREPRWSVRIPLRTPWSDHVSETRRPPRYVDSHSEGNYFMVTVAQAGEVREVLVDGTTFGSIVSESIFFQRLSRIDPVVLTGCNAAGPGVSGGLDAAAELVKRGAVGPIYGGISTVRLIIGDGESSLAVDVNPALMKEKSDLFERLDKPLDEASPFGDSAAYEAQ
ncbi:hypothetical protein [Nocardia brasiliensis]|uniref:hypothetical protein n=1 Tax=Nocardia brasiliensis TaxID=37326 RepID=UPI002456AAA9|nr:hypothetical protein [Nocardia brasiliensis]